MAQALGVLIALAVGLVTWGFTLVFSGGNPFGTLRSTDTIVFFTPIVAMFGPLTINALQKSRFVLAAWMAALAPIVGILNGVLFIIIARVTGGSADGFGLPAILTIGVWIVPFVHLLRKMRIEDGAS